MTFDEAEAACIEVRRLCDDVLCSGAAEDAKTLQQKCLYYAARMRGRFGNVAEQLGRIITAAKGYQKKRVNITSANSNLHTALMRMVIALDIHRYQP